MHRLPDLPDLPSNFVPLDKLARAHGHDPGEVRRAIAGRLLPGIPYIPEDGTELVAPDCFELAHMDTIERLTGDPHPHDDDWRRELSAAVDALDALEKPFALFDRERLGPVSRDGCVTAVRERFNLDLPQVSMAGDGTPVPIALGI
jgi:hypothetical protein